MTSTERKSDFDIKNEVIIKEVNNNIIECRNDMVNYLDGDMEKVKTFEKSFMSLVSGKKTLLSYSPESLKNCFITSCEVGLPIDSRGYCYIVPYKGDATLRIGYLGMLKLASKNGFKIIQLKDVYEGDIITSEIKEDGNEVFTFIDNNLFDKCSDKMKGVALYYEFDGVRRLETMSITEIEKIKANATSSKVWDEWYLQMCFKAIIRRVLKTKIFDNPRLDKVIELDNQDYNLNKTDSDILRDKYKVVDLPEDTEEDYKDAIVEEGVVNSQNNYEVADLPTKEAEGIITPENIKMLIQNCPDLDTLINLRHSAGKVIDISTFNVDFKNKNDELQKKEL